MTNHFRQYPAAAIEFKVYYFVLENLTEMLFRDSKNPTDEEGEEESEVVKEAMRVFMEKYVQRLRLFDLKSKLMVVRLCKNLRVLNIEFGDDIKI